MTHFCRARRALAVEDLESRRLLAGDVSVATIGGNLLINGDAAGNQIEIRSLDTPGRFTLRGLLGPSGEITTINGNAEPLLVDRIDGQVLAHMGAGNDALVVRSARFASGVFLSTGPGDDAVIVGGLPSDPNGASIGVESEAVPSVVIGGPLVIRAGPGSDHVAITNSHARNAVVHGGVGPDHVASIDSVFGNLAIHLGQGNDSTLAVRTTVHGSALFSGGAGLDSLHGGMNSFNHARVVGFEANGTDADDEDDPIADSSSVFV